MAAMTARLPRLGSLFSGYGGLDMAVDLHAPVELAWVSEVDSAACRVLAHHWPEAPNLGDVTRVDWGAVPPVDILAGGSPCQDVSLAGARAGMTEGTRSNLWAAMRSAIDHLRPALVVWENVQGAHSAQASSLMESGPRCVGERLDLPVLRATGRVAGDLASLGYDAGWVTVSAADVGACHRRARVFLLAWRRDPAPDADEFARIQRWLAASWQAPGGGTGSAASGHHRAPVGLPPGPVGAAGAELLRTPTTQPEQRPGPGYGRFSLAQQVSGRDAAAWGEYLPVITRHAEAVGRPAPIAAAPLKPGGRPRLRPEFVEWMMMVPEGHVTNPELGLSRAAMFRMLGNGVVPAQAAHALRVLAPIADQQLTQRVWGRTA